MRTDVEALRQAIDDAAWHMARNDFAYLALALQRIVDAIEALEKKIDALA